MEVQEFLPMSMVCQLRFPAAVELLDRRGRLLRLVEDALDAHQWELSDTAIRGRTEDDMVTAVVTFQDVRLGFHGAIDEAIVAESCASVLPELLEALEVKEVGQIGCRVFWIAAADSFESAHDWLAERLNGAVTATMFQALSSRPTDSGWVFELHDQAPKWNLRAGPMRREEWEPKQGMTALQAEALPPNSVFIDVDRVANDQSHPISVVRSEIERAITKSFDAGRRVVTTLASSGQAADDEVG
jgi:hypothetical protein